MTLIKNDIELTKTKETEERNATEAKRVEAGNDFTIKTVDRQVAGINTARLSVLKT